MYKLYQSVYELIGAALHKTFYLISYPYELVHATFNIELLLILFHLYSDRRNINKNTVCSK